MNVLLTNRSKMSATQISESRITITIYMLVAGVFYFVLASPSYLAAQGSLNPDFLVTNATQTPIEGVGHDYIHDLSETVNPQNGQVSIRIAGPAPHERGQNLPHYAYMYDTSGREAMRFSPELVQCEENPPGVGLVMCDAEVVGPGQSNYALNQFSPNYVYGISAPNPTILNTMFSLPVNQAFTNPQIPPGVNNNAGKYTCEYNGYTFFDSYGGLHDLNLHIQVIMDPPTDNCAGMQYETDYFGGDSSVKAVCQHDTNCSAVYAATSSGTLITGGGGIIGTIEDTNGNGANGTGRPMSLTTTTVNGYPQPPHWGSGQSSTYTGLATITLPGVSGAYTYNYASFSRSAALNVSASVNSASTGGSCFASSLANTTQSTSFADVSSLTLPNGQFYSFGYDGQWGLVNSITYPTGGKVTYTWGVNASSEFYNVVTPSLWNSFLVNGPQNCYFEYDLPVVKKRIVSFDGTHPALEQDFAYSTTWGTNGFWSAKKTTVTTKDLTRPGSPKTVIIYNYIPMFPPRLATGSSSKSVIPHEDTVVYEDGAGNTLRKVKKVWVGVDQLGAECEILDNGMVSGKFYQYQQISGAYQWSDGSDQVIDLAEYDYTQGVTSACVQPPSSTPPARETKTQYATIPSSVLWQPAESAAIPQTNDRPSVVQVYDHGTLVAETDVAYDQTSVSAVSPAAYNHDETNFGHNQVAGRGNATTITKKCFNCVRNSVTTVQYDETGQIAAVTDPNGNTATLSYADNYSTGGTPPGNTNTYLTKITRPSTNGVKHISSFAYHYTFGELTSATDENGQTSTYHYNDTWGRPTLASAPDGGQTEKVYNDSAPSPNVTTCQLINGTAGATCSASRPPTGWKVALNTMDGIGQLVQTELVSDPDGATFTATTYDGLGREYQVYSPTRCDPPTTNCGTEPTWGFTAYTYDALGRVTAVTHPDGTSLSTTYTGRATEVTDEGNGTHNVQRISQSDAFGRLTSVCEATSAKQSGGGAPSACSQDITGTGFLTSYQYNALNNLISVQQGSRSRSFSYDGLSRLLCAANPETSGSASCPYPDKGSYTPGTTRYGYDANGNTVQRIRPAPNQANPATTVTTTYSYDALNRLTSTTYSDGVTPTVTRHYDTATELGRVLNYTTGRLSAEYVTSPSGTLLSGKLFGYDPVGRVNDNSQCTPSSGCKTTTAPVISYSYDVLGDVSTAGNGAGTTFSYGYSTAGRLKSLTSSLSDSNHPETLFSGVTYNPFGSPTGGSLGNALNEARVYDCRGRVLAYASVVYPLAPSLSSIANTAGCTNTTAFNRGISGPRAFEFQSDTLARNFPLTPKPPDPMSMVNPFSVLMEKRR